MDNQLEHEDIATYNMRRRALTWPDKDTPVVSTPLSEKDLEDLEREYDAKINQIRERQKINKAVLDYEFTV